MKYQNKWFKIFKPSELIIYLSLIALAAFFLSGMIEEYLEDNTNFSIIQESMSKEDLPTITVCLKSESSATKLKYGRDLTVQAIASNLPPWLPEANATIFNLNEGINEYYFVGQKRQTILNHLRVHQFLSDAFIDRSCISMKLSVMEEALVDRVELYGTAYDVGSFIFTLSEEIAKSVHQAILYTTSENNSFGAVLNRWLDGGVQPFHLARGTIHPIMITNIKRYQYLKAKCQPLSFYGCLSEKLVDKNLCPIQVAKSAPGIKISIHS